MSSLYWRFDLCGVALIKSEQRDQHFEARIEEMLVTKLNNRADIRKNRVLLGTSGELCGGVHTLTLVSRGKGFELDALWIRR